MSFDLRRTKQTIFGQSTDFLIGELLLKAGIIKQNQLDDALKLAGNKHMQIGQMLIMARYITPKELQAALDAQAAIRDRLIDMNGALRALSMAHRNGLTFAEASHKQSQDTAIVPTHKLGQLLLEADIITGEQFSIALQKSMAIGLPLGRILILNNVISEPILSCALDTLIKLRDGQISREEAFAVLSDASNKKVTKEIGLAGLEEGTLFHSQFEAISQRGIRLGEFLVLAGILSETDVMNALEFSLVNEKTLGEMLLEHGYVTRELVEAALKLQALIQNESMDTGRAARCLSHMHTNSVTLNEAIEAVNNEAADGSRVDFQTLLLESNIITSEGIQSALELAVGNPRILAKILTQTGYLSEPQANIMLECHETIIQNMISEQDAKFVLDYCLQKMAEGPMSFTQGLEELGWTAPADEGQASFGQISSPVTQSETNQGTTPSTQSSSDLMNAVMNMGAPGKSFVLDPASPAFMFNSGTKMSSISPDLSSTPSPSTSSGPPKTTASSSPAAVSSSGQFSQPVKESQSSETANQQNNETSSALTKSRRTNRTTANMPALTQMQAGNELMRPPDEESDSTQSAIVSQDNAPALVQLEPNKLAQSSGGSTADKSLSLRALLKEEETAISSLNPELLQQNAAAKTAVEEESIDTEGFELSESEKALIIKASSLTASPEEIMAAMKLAAKKEKTIQSQDKETGAI